RVPRGEAARRQSQSMSSCPDRKTPFLPQRVADRRRAATLIATSRSASGCYRAGRDSHRTPVNFVASAATGAREVQYAGVHELGKITLRGGRARFRKIHVLRVGHTAF